VQIQGITLVLAAYRRPYHDIKDFTRLGLDPKSFKMIVVKSGYLSPELAPIANPSLMALTDGAINQDIVHLPANRYRRPSYPFVADLSSRRRSTGLRGIDPNGVLQPIALRTSRKEKPRGCANHSGHGDSTSSRRRVEHLAVLADLLKAAAVDPPDVPVFRRQ